MATAVKTTTAPSAPRLPRSVQKKTPTYADMKVAAAAAMRLKIKQDLIEAERKPHIELLTKYAQGETFQFHDGKVQVTRATEGKPLDTYDILFDQDAWDKLGDTPEKQLLQEQLVRLGVVTLERSFKKAHPSQVKVFLADENP